MTTISSRLSTATLCLWLCAFAGCGSDDDADGAPATATPTRAAATATAAATPRPTASPTPADPGTVPNFAAARFTDPTRIDNPFMPLVPGTTTTYAGETEDGTETIMIEVRDEIRVILGVTTRVVRDRAFLDGTVIEDTEDWFAQDDDGNVWYMGEAVDNYNYDDEGTLIDITHEGSWEAGTDLVGVGAVAKPGYAMPANPSLAMIYNQEFYPGEAEDMAEVLSLDAPVTLASGATYTCLQTRDYTPLEPSALEHKFYARGVGLVLEVNVENGDRVELQDAP